MKLVFLNMKTRKLEVYDKTGMKNLPFSGINNIKNTLGKEEVLYITNATKMPSSKIISAIFNLNKQTIKNAIEDNSDLYIHSTSKKTIILKVGEENFAFSGPKDFKPLKLVFEKFGKDILEKHPVIKRLMDQGQLEILSVNEAKSNYSQILEEEKEKQAAIEKIKNKYSSDDEKPSIDRETMWSDKNPLAIGGGSVRSISESSIPPGGGGSFSNEGSLITDDGDLIG